MRILALTSLYPNPLQPHRAPFNRQQFRALASEHEVQVIAPIAWTTELTARRKQTSPTLPRSRERIADGMIIHHPRYAFTPKVFRGAYGRFFLKSVRGRFEDVIRRWRPDIVLGCWAYPDGWAAIHLAREANLPVVIKVQGSDLLTIDDQPARVRRTADALIQADAVIAVSQHLRSKAIAMGAAADQVHVVYNGIDAEVFSPGSKAVARSCLGLTSPDPLLLFAGNLVPVKGLDTLLQSLAIVARAGTRFQCALVGEGPLRGPLQAQAHSLGLLKQVHFFGSRPLHEIPQWYRAADLVVLPSRSEGVPNVLLEAAACGTPFVASRVGGTPEIAGPESLVPSGDADALAARIGDVLRGRCCLTSHPTFKARSWATSAQDIASVLDQVRLNHTRHMALVG